MFQFFISLHKFILSIENCKSGDNFDFNQLLLSPLQQMNNFTGTHKQLNRKTPILIHISDIANQEKLKKSAHTSESSQKNSSRKKIDSFRPQMHDFPEIFTKRKREDYSGYKQYNLNKSKLVCLDQMRREKQLKYPSRKYEVNLKNIIKLKKRYSLEPTHFKSLYKEKKISIKEKQMRPTLQQESVFNRTSQQLKLRQLMKNILFQHNIQQKIPIYLGCTSDRLNVQQNMTDFQRYRSQMYTQSGERQLDKLQKGQNSFKISLQKIEISREGSKRKPKITIKTQQSPSSTNNEMQKQLCGWENTLYDVKNKQKLILYKSMMREDQ